MALQTSNLGRFQPRVAAKASGTPLRRWQYQVQHAANVVVPHRKLPLTEVQLMTIRVGKGK